MKKNGSEIMTLSKNTKVGLTFGQILSLITIAGTFIMGYANLNSRIAAMEKSKIEKEEFYQIKETLIRIEGKLDLKQDRFK